MSDEPARTPSAILRDVVGDEVASEYEERIGRQRAVVGEYWHMAKRRRKATMTLSGFLSARIAEDEADAVGGAWQVDPDDFERIVDGDGIYVADVMGPGNARLIARHDPTRVLAECEAKRRIVAFVAGTQRHAGEPPGADPDDAEALNHILTALALPYADHPDYREEWRP